MTKHGFDDGGGFFDSQPSLIKSMASKLADDIQGTDVDHSNYRDDAPGFMKEVLKIKHLWSKLEEVCLSVQNNQYTAVQSANGVGKTYIAARVGVWWFNTFPDDCKIITTAPPPARQIKELLWGEIKSTLRQAKQKGIELHGGDPGSMTLRQHDSWWMQGFTIPMTGTKEERIAKFQGHHSENLLIIVDESHGVPPEVIEAIDSCMTGGHNHILMLSNPLAPSGPFHDAVRDPKYNVIHISAFDHPNVETGDNIIPGAITREKTEERIKAWSRALYPDEDYDANCYVVPDFFSEEVAGQSRRITMPFLATKTLGTFPEYAENAVIPTFLIQAAVERWVDAPPDIPSVTDAKIVAGLDVAEMGPDSNAWIIRQGSWTSHIDRWNGVNPTETAGKATLKAKALGTDVVIVDSNNVGVSVPSHLTHNGIAAIGVKFSFVPTVEVSKEEELEGEFNRMRDQLYWAIREWLKTDTNAMLPPDGELTQELSVLSYEITLNGKISVLAKPKIRELIGRSPDALDALALTFYRDKPWKELEFISV